MLRILAISLFAFYLYTRAFNLIFVTWDYFYIFMCADDVALCGASNRTIKSRSSIVT